MKIRIVEPTIRARTIEGFVLQVRELGGDPAGILARVGIALNAAEDPLEWISFPAVLRAYEAAAAETRCPTFGLRLGMNRQLSFLGALQLIVSYSQDLGSGFDAFCRFASVQNTGCQPCLDVGPQEATFQLLLNPQLRRWGQQWIEESLIVALRLMRECLGENYVPRRVTLQSAASTDKSIYESCFGTEVCTTGRIDAITIDKCDLEIVNARRDAELVKVLGDYLREEVMPARSDLNGTVKRVLRRSLGSETISIEAVAFELHMHRRTLQRRLRDTGTTFAELLDEVRAEAARHYLSAGQLPLTRVALQLGFSDQSAFNHAFRRWFQRSPTEWSARVLP